MCGLCLAGLLAAPGRRLLEPRAGPGALGLVVILWMVWIDPPADLAQDERPRARAGGALVGWAAGGVPARPPRLAALGARRRLAGVFALTVLWELGEYVGDLALGTALIPSKRDSALDIVFGTSAAPPRWRSPALLRRGSARVASPA